MALKFARWRRHFASYPPTKTRSNLPNAKVNFVRYFNAPLANVSFVKVLHDWHFLRLLRISNLIGGHYSYAA